MFAILCAIANSSAMQTESRSTSPERTSQQSDAVAQFFVSVPTQGFPTENKQKAQPWRRVWKPQAPTEDGKLIVACPKICVFGMPLLLSLRTRSPNSHRPGSWLIISLQEATIWEDCNRMRLLYTRSLSQQLLRSLCRWRLICHA